MTPSPICHILKKLTVGIVSLSIGLLPTIQSHASDDKPYHPGDFELQPVYYKTVPQANVNEVMIDESEILTGIEIAQIEPAESHLSPLLPVTFVSGLGNVVALIIFSIQALSRWENLGQSPLPRPGGCERLAGREAYDCNMGDTTFIGILVTSVTLFGVIYAYYFFKNLQPARAR